MQEPFSQSNRLIEQLRQEGNFTIGRLKALYRALCKETHPDVASGREQDFLQLRDEYEEALKILEKRPVEGIDGDGLYKTGDLESLLSLFAVRGLSRENNAVIESLISVLETSEPDTSADWRLYRDVFFKTFPSWQHRGPVFYTHGLFLSAFRQYQYYLDKKNERNLHLLKGLVKDLKVKTVSRRIENGDILTRLAEWLEKHACGCK